MGHQTDLEVTYRAISREYQNLEFEGVLTIKVEDDIANTILAGTWPPLFIVAVDSLIYLKGMDKPEIITVRQI